MSLLMAEGLRRTRAVEQHYAEQLHKKFMLPVLYRIWWFYDCQEVQRRANFLLTWNGK